MLTLYSWPELCGVADNNGYGLKVFAFLRLTGVPFRQEHLFEAARAPRGQLPYVLDEGETIGDSDAILSHLTRKYRLFDDHTSHSAVYVNRRPKLTPYRRATLTPLGAYWEQAAIERASNSAVASERLAVVRPGF